MFPQQMCSRYIKVHELEMDINIINMFALICVHMEEFLASSSVELSMEANSVYPLTQQEHTKNPTNKKRKLRSILLKA